MDTVKKEVVVAVSGGFDPLHIGHVRMFEEAKALGDRLIVIINNDNWIKKKKGYVFMPETERMEIIRGLRAVDDVVFTDHGEDPHDMSVCSMLRKIVPDVFANGGDRKPDGDPVPEVDVCRELGIEMVYNVGTGGKVQSSSWLVDAAAKHKKK